MKDNTLQKYEKYKIYIKKTPISYIPYISSSLLEKKSWLKNKFHSYSNIMLVSKYEKIKCKIIKKYEI